MDHRTLTIGMIGHKFMGKAHSHAIRDVNMFFDTGVQLRMKTICGTNESVARSAERYGWESYETDWRKVVEDPQIDIIDISSPGATHMEIAVAAAEAGKHVICEKPLAMTAAEAERMYDAAKKSSVKNMVNFCYRRVPDVTLAKRLIDNGRIGEIYHFKASYQQDWAEADSPYVWRFDKKLAGAGSMADNGSHIIDLARYLVGEITEVAAMSDILVRRHKDPVTNENREVTTDDAAMFITRFEGGVMGTFETSRISAGYKNGLRFEVNGSKGSIRFDLERLNELEVYFTEQDKTTQGFRTIIVTEPEHPYMDHWWPLGHIIGWEHSFIHQYYEFIRAIVDDTEVKPDFYDGWINMRVIDAVERAANEKTWVAIPNR